LTDSSISSLFDLFTMLKDDTPFDFKKASRLRSSSELLKNSSIRRAAFPAVGVDMVSACMGCVVSASSASAA